MALQQQRALLALHSFLRPHCTDGGALQQLTACLTSQAAGTLQCQQEQQQQQQCWPAFHTPHVANWQHCYHGGQLQGSEAAACLHTAALQHMDSQPQGAAGVLQHTLRMSQQQQQQPGAAQQDPQQQTHVVSTLGCWTALWGHHHCHWDSSTTQRPCIGLNSSSSSSSRSASIARECSFGRAMWQHQHQQQQQQLRYPLGAPDQLQACRRSHSSSTGSSSSTGRAQGTGSSSGDAVTNSSDGSKGSWAHRYLPGWCVPYAQLMRLDKPIGSWLLAWPGLWSIALASGPGTLPDPWLTALFGCGAVLMRGAGCTINDLWDRDIDARVERTRSRPLAAGTVTPTAALLFLAAQLSASLAILLQLNTYTQVLGVASLSLVVTYPLMKRVTWWPQAFLGLAMNYGVLMGYAAAAGACDWAVVGPMYGAGVAWTLVYDTIYAHQDKRDDALVGVKSTALLFGDKTKQWAAGFAVLQALGMTLAGSAAGCGLPYFAGVAAGSAHVAWQIKAVDLHNGPDCMAKFVSNKWYGALVYAGIVLDRLLAA